MQERWMIRVFGLVLSVATCSVCGALRAGCDTPQGDMGTADRLMAERKWSEAAASLEVVTRREAGNLAAWRKLCECYAELGEVDRAIQAGRAAVDLPEAGPDTAYLLARLYGRKGEIDNAFKTLNRAIDGGFCDRADLETNPDLSRLRQDDRYGFVQRRLAGASASILGAMDFLAGEWEVVGKDGKPAGGVIIEKRARRYGLSEAMQSKSGESVQGLFYADSLEKKWKYVSISSGGDVVQCECATIGPEMRFEGTFRGADGRIRPLRMTWTRAADGRVARRVEQSKDDGKSWVTFFEGWYAPQGKRAP